MRAWSVGPRQSVAPRQVGPQRSEAPGRCIAPERARIASILGALLLAAAAPALAQDQPEQIVEGPEGVTLNFQEADIRTVLATLAELAGLTVVYAGLPQTPVTLRSAHPVPLGDMRQMLEGVAGANGLAVTEGEGGLITIAQRQQPAEPERSQEAAPQEQEVQLFVKPLRHAQASDLAATLRDLFGLGTQGGGRPARPRALSEQLREQLVPPDMRPRDDGGQEVAVSPPLSGELAGPVRIVPEPSTNALLIRAGARDFATIEAAIDQLDTRPLQVLIEVMIAEVRRERRFESGVDIALPNQRGIDSNAEIGADLFSQSVGDFALRILQLGGVDADVIINAMAASSEVTILSRPVALAQNNREARILVGSERPFVQLFRALPTDAAVRDQVVQYRDVGTQLTITPTINPDGYVSMTVLQEVSTATSEVQFGAPVISTREAETQLLVRDGHTAVIGGLIDQQREDAESGIPLLKDIPLLGGLFRSTQRRNGTTELFLFITPHVIRSDDDMRSTTDTLRSAAPHLDEALPDTLPILRRHDGNQQNPIDDNQQPPEDGR